MSISVSRINTIPNRTLLKTKTSKLKPLLGPDEKAEAQSWVAAYIAGNVSIAAFAAQVPVGDEVALTAVEIGMATHIFRGIYGFNLGETTIKSLLAGASGLAAGKIAFKMATKTLTWIPGIGNVLNAVVSGTVTAALGALLIDMAEKIDAGRKRGEKMDDIIRKLEEDLKNKNKGKKP